MFNWGVTRPSRFDGNWDLLWLQALRPAFPINKSTNHQINKYSAGVAQLVER